MKLVTIAIVPGACNGLPRLCRTEVGKDMRRDEDLVAYFREVMILREQRKCNK